MAGNHRNSLPGFSKRPLPQLHGTVSDDPSPASLPDPSPASLPNPSPASLPDPSPANKKLKILKEYEKEVKTKWDVAVFEVEGLMRASTELEAKKLHGTVSLPDPSPASLPDPSPANKRLKILNEYAKEVKTKWDLAVFEVEGLMRASTELEAKKDKCLHQLESGVEAFWQTLNLVKATCSSDKLNVLPEDTDELEYDEECIAVEQTRDGLELQFQCPCSKGYKILISGNHCFYKLLDKKF
ncbi:hypothetical protein V6N11_038338 [Hibiscus sabdariffa]|uniref:Uncharacterized protein n=1 Tax=Hibiscus sabdariffa TaxID=183260 RepID=A0ABR2SJM8_9ROSI